ncbi:hypothetical protein JQS43_22420 [Natronosporangium hydrolyticum]|uniref:Uncharacterized protein n=1 Tax=Natronosporangium hydrolyticum TaxID=2811111 RepID=A0A895Y924_9ACTN|nr:hypothetical protein [Natronosporangium hydrolyticum]QSB14237.1 hypothetical protein JQS43_22420 [Natronosporangium hydrolyticum]
MLPWRSPSLGSASPGALSPPLRTARQRLAVSLLGESRLPDESPKTEVDINGETGQLGFPWEAEGESSDTRWLIFPDASDQMVLVQIPAGLGLTRAPLQLPTAGPVSPALWRLLPARVRL